MKHILNLNKLQITIIKYTIYNEKEHSRTTKKYFQGLFLRNLLSFKNMITKNNSTNEIEIDKSLFIIEETNIANDKTKSEEQDIEETPDYEDDPPKLRYKKLQNKYSNQ